MHPHQRMTSCASPQNLTGLCNLNCTAALPAPAFFCDDLTGANDVDGTQRCLLAQTGRNVTCAITAPLNYPSSGSGRGRGAASARATSKCGLLLLAIVAVATLA